MNIATAYNRAKEILGPCAAVSKEYQVSSGGRACVCSVGVQDGHSLRVLATGQSWWEALERASQEKRKGRTR